MKKVLTLATTLFLTLGLLGGCAADGGKSSEAKNTATAKATATTATAKAGETKGENGKKKKIALLTDRAGTQVFILSMIDGLNASAEKYGFEAVVAESADAAAFEDNARALIEEGVDLLIGGGWMAGEAISKMAQEFPDAAKYALIDSTVDEPNVKCIAYREQEGAYLIGMIAAMVADENEDVFGAVHVFDGAGSWKWRYGYMEGVKTKYPKAKFVFNYVGNFNDPAKAKEFAIQQFEQGASFINSAAAGGDKGVFEAALEKKFYTSGQDVDLTTPDNPQIVTCQIKDTNSTISRLIDLYFSDKEWTGDDEVWGIKEGTIGAVYVTQDSKTPRSDKLTDDNIKTLKQAAEDIASGKIEMTNIPAEETYKK